MIDPASRRTAALLLLALGLGCTTVARRQALLKNGLDDWRYPRAAAEIWPELQKLLDERQYPLVGADRAAVGGATRNWLLESLSFGYETRARPTGGRILETGSNAEGYRIRAEAWPVKDGGTRVQLTRLKRDDTNPAGVVETRDLELELALLQRIDPVAAARIEGVPPPRLTEPAAAADDPWRSLRHLVGTWEAEPAGGLPAVTWTFDVGAGGQRMEFRGSPLLGPRSPGPEEMGVLTRDPTRKKVVWREFTAAGPVNEYLLEQEQADRLVFVSERPESLPPGTRLRLTLGRDGGEVVAIFEQAEPGKELAVVAESRLKRKP